MKHTQTLTHLSFWWWFTLRNAVSPTSAHTETKSTHTHTHVTPILNVYLCVKPRLLKWHTYLEACWVARRNERAARSLHLTLLPNSHCRKHTLKHTHIHTCLRPNRRAKKNSGCIYIIHQYATLYRSFALLCLFFWFPSHTHMHTHTHTHTLWKVFVSLVCCNSNSSDSESNLGHPKSTPDNYYHMLHWLTSGALPLYPILSCFLFVRSRIRPRLSCRRNKQDLVCITWFVKRGQECLEQPIAELVFQVPPHWYPPFFFPFSISPFHRNFYFIPLIHVVTFLTSSTLMGKKTHSYPVMREPCLLQSQRGLIKLLCAVIENTTQRLVADSCCVGVSTCVNVFLLLHGLFVCVCN